MEGMRYDPDLEVIALVAARNKATKISSNNKLVANLRSMDGIVWANKGGKAMCAEAADTIQSLEIRCKMLEQMLHDTESSLRARLDEVTKERDKYKRGALAWKYQAKKLEHDAREKSHDKDEESL